MDVSGHYGCHVVVRELIGVVESKNIDLNRDKINACVQCALNFGLAEVSKEEQKVLAGVLFKLRDLAQNDRNLKLVATQDVIAKIDSLLKEIIVNQNSLYGALDRDIRGLIVDQLQALSGPYEGAQEGKANEHYKFAKGVLEGSEKQFFDIAREMVRKRNEARAEGS